MPACYGMLDPLDPRPLLAATGSGLLATYFNNANFTGTTVSRVESSVAFNWTTGSPDRRIAADTFAARWTGQVRPRFSETYIFKTSSDDGVRLWVNHRLLIDSWNQQNGLASHMGRITLIAGERYDIQFEYREKR